MVLQSVENKDIGVLESHRLKAPSFRRKGRFLTFLFSFYKVLACCIILSFDDTAGSTLSTLFVVEYFYNN